MKQPKIINEQQNEILKALSGEWYISSYNNQNSKDIITSLLKIEFNIIKYIVHNKLHSLGSICETNSNQIFIKFKTLESQICFIMIIDKKDIHKQVFKLLMSYKKFGTLYNLTRFSILSRLKFSDNDIKKALGNPKDVILLEDKNLEERVAQLYIDSQKDSKKV